MPNELYFNWWSAHLFISKATYSKLAKVQFLPHVSLPDFYWIIQCQHYIIWLSYKEQVFSLFILPSVLGCVQVENAGTAFPALLYSTESVNRLSSSLMSAKFLHWSVQFPSVQFKTTPSCKPTLYERQHLRISLRRLVCIFKLQMIGWSPTGLYWTSKKWIT